jgi:hypothetical protein
MSFDSKKLYDLLPVIYRIRDEERGGSLKEIISVIAEQISLLEENLEQLYDDQFIETCAEWVVPYIGDLIGVRVLDNLKDAAINKAIKKGLSRRAQIANTIAYRRRKGTAAVLEQLARDSTGWDARVVEFFQLIATTQYMNHIRPNNLSMANIKQWEPLERLNTLFDSMAHTDVLTENGVIEITDNGCYIFEQPLKKDLAKGQRIEIRSANGRRPTLVLKGDFQINGSDDAEITLNGLLITGGKLQVNGSIKALRIRHCTLVPGIGLKINGDTEHPDDPSIVVKSSETKIEIDHSIVGGLRIDKDASIKISNSIIDAISENKVAYAGIDGISAGGEISIENSTVIGKIHTFLLKVASNTILIADLISGDGWPAPVISERRQEGCVRFSYLPMNSQVPRRYRCQPDLAIQQKIDDSRIKPEFTSLRYDDPGYVQLRMICPVEIRKGAEDESEMGVFHNLYQPQRETNLRVRLDEYLRFGLEAGIFYAS